jgi:hypothetical protein
MRKITVIVAMLMVFCLSSCSFLEAAFEPPTPEDTIERLEGAIQNTDFDGIIGCFEPHVASGLRAAMGLAGGLFDVDGEAIFDMIPLMLDIAKLSDEEFADNMEMFKALNIEVLNVEYNADGDAADVEVAISLDGAASGTMVDYIPMVLDDGEWYVSLDISL